MSSNTDSAINNLTGFIGNFGVKIGTWTAGPGTLGTTAIAINSGGTAVIMGGANVAVGMGGATPTPAKVDYKFTDGHPIFTITPNLSTEAGTYWMMVKLS